jgi:hypothetical protein
MKKIYAVNSGSYSDYRVVALFSTPERAQEFMAAVPDSDYNGVEEFELNPDTADLIKRGYSLWLVHMLRDGNTERVEQLKLSLYGVDDVGHHIWRRTQAPAYKSRGIPDCLTSTVWAKSEEAAVKIVNEYRARMIASGEWS